MGREGPLGSSPPARPGAWLFGALMLAAVSAAQAQFAAADAAIQRAIANRVTPGAVLIAGDARGIRYRKAYGRLGYDQPGEPGQQPWPAVTPGTVYDLASLTKSIATGTAVLQLVDQGRVALSAPVSQYLPEFTGQGKEAITVEQLLTHHGGLIADNPISDYASTPEAAWRAICESAPQHAPGTRFEYSDVGFIVLGKLVERLSGLTLAAYTQRHILHPLRMQHSGFRPDGALPKSAVPRSRIAPTERADSKAATSPWLQGRVHDPRAQALGGAAGHAGLFGTADDVARWCQMLLNGGQAHGTQVLQTATVADLARARTLPPASPDTSSQSPTPGTARGLSVDIDTRFSPAPRGTVFAAGRTFGHTGYTGTAYWVDPVNGVFYALLSNRVHPNDKASVSALRREVASAVATALLMPPR